MKSGKYILYIIFFLAFTINLFSAVNSQSLYEQGMEAFKTANYGSSELLFRKIIESDDSSEYKEKAWYYLALSIFNQKNYKASIFEFNRFLLICTKQDLCLEARFWIAESYYYLKDYIRSIEEFKRFISQSKNDSFTVSAHDRIGEIYFLQSRYDEATIEWKEAIAKSANVTQNNQRMIKIGEALFLNESYDDSLNVLESLLSSRSDKLVESKARLFIGKIYQIKNRHRDALKILYGIPESILKEIPFCEAQYLKATSSIALGDDYSAKSYLESFLLIGKNSDYYYDAKYELGNILIKQGNEKAGMEHLLEVKNSTRKMGLRSKAALVLSKIYLKRNPEDAIPYLEDAVSQDDPKEQRNVILLLSRVYVDVKRFEDAERLLNMLANTYQDDRDNDLVQFLIARIALEKKDIAKAVEGFDKIKDINPASSYILESNYYIALAYTLQEQYVKAIDMFKKYLTNPKAEKRYDASVQLLKLYIKVDDIKNSEKMMWSIINNFIKQDGVDSVIFDFAIVMKEKNLNYNKYFQMVLNNFPRSESAGKLLVILGDIAFHKKNYYEAEQYYKQYLFVESRPNMQLIFLSRIISLYNLGRYKEIIALFNGTKFLSGDEYISKQLSLWLGRSYYQSGNYEMAYKIMFNRPFSDYDASDLLIIQKCAIEIGDLASALAVPPLLLNKGQELYASSLYAIGMHFKLKKQNDAASDYFLKILAECSGSSYADSARLEMAEINIKNRKFADAIEKLTKIKDIKELDRKNALLIISYFRLGKIKEAIELTQANIKKLLNLPYGEIVVKENLFYYYLNNDLDKFKVYSEYLRKYSGNDPLLSYLSAKLNFEQEQYNNAYYFFYKLVQLESEYKEEALFHLGIISLFKQKNKKLAVSYFQKLAEINNSDNVYVMKAKLNLSILLNESGNIDKSNDVLNDIIIGPENLLIKIQAGNLWNYYGYTKKMNAKDTKER